MRIEVYKDKKREYRWRAVATNGRILADSGESYHNLGDLYDVVSTLRSIGFSRAEIVMQDDVRINTDVEKNTESEEKAVEK